MKRIGDILIENKLLTKEDLTKALSYQKNLEVHKSIGEILIEMDLINIEILMKYLDFQEKQHS